MKKYAALPAMAALGITLASTTVAQAQLDHKAITQTWAQRVISSDPVFPLHGAQKPQSLDWALVYTQDTDLIDQLIAYDPEISAQIHQPRTLTDYAGEPIDKPTLMRAQDNSAVVALPFDSVEITPDGLAFHGVRAGDVFSPQREPHAKTTTAPETTAETTTTPDDTDATTAPTSSAEQNPPETPSVDASATFTMPVGAAPDSLRALYSADGGVTTTGTATTQAVAPIVTVTSDDLAYAGTRGRLINGQGINPLSPGGEITLTRSAQITNPAGRSTHGRMKAFTTTENPDEDRLDGIEDGLTPIPGAETSQSIPEEGLTQELHFTVPKDASMVYVRTDVVDDDDAYVAPPTMHAFNVLKTEIDSQASTEDKNTTLRPETKQKVFNEVDLTSLSPGQPYHVIAQLFQCTAGDCKEIAAVNREIIPREEISKQYFSVNVDTTGFTEDTTLEWATQVRTGTGDFNNMGPVVSTVVSEPNSTVLSLSGSVNAQREDGTRRENHAGSTQQIHGLEIGEEHPPAGKEEVRKNA
ncbi:hypothetical protein, partial [Corynebacterium mastitidis]|uniref:hypothetical protein n=1 Tax=Corynebacterium mastitidis TaxID=161890 RepID=UPI003CC80F0D